MQKGHQKLGLLVSKMPQHGPGGWALRWLDPYVAGPLGGHLRSGAGIPRAFSSPCTSLSLSLRCSVCLGPGREASYTEVLSQEGHRKAVARLRQQGHRETGVRGPAGGRAPWTPSHTPLTGPRRSRAPGLSLAGREGQQGSRRGARASGVQAPGAVQSRSCVLPVPSMSPLKCEPS